MVVFLCTLRVKYKSHAYASNLCEKSGCTTYSLAEQLESIKESFDEKNLEALDLFLECKKVSLFTLLL